MACLKLQLRIKLGCVQSSFMRLKTSFNREEYFITREFVAGVEDDELGSGAINCSNSLSLLSADEDESMLVQLYNVLALDI